MRLSILVRAQISTFPYTENFENGPGGWAASGVSSSWVLADPGLATINSAASGDSAWVTALGGGSTGTPGTGYNANENSQVLSPQFDFTSLGSPIINMSVWWNSEFSWDGAVLQSSIDNGVSWQNVGAFGDPNNWYTDNTIAGNPGGQPEGWSGRGAPGPFGGSGGWVTAEHDLTGLGGQSSVLLRVAFGADGSVQDDGFAFDDVAIFDAPAIELAALALPMPNSGCGLSATDTVSITYTNRGSGPVDSTSVTYTINGGAPVTELDTTTLQPGDTVTYVFNTTANLSVIGNYAVKGWITKAGDPINLNDTTNKSIDNLPAISTFPYLEDFESGPGGWTTGGALSSWQLGLPSGGVIIGAASGSKAWMTDTANTYPNSENSFVISPCMNMSSLNAPIVRLKVWWDSEFSWDGAVLQASTDAGITWGNVGAFGDPDNWFNDNTIAVTPVASRKAGPEQALRVVACG